MTSLTRPEIFLALAEEVKNHLRFLSQFGCTGVTCSDQALDTIRSWDLQNICRKVGQCRRCSLSGHRRRVVCGLGNSGAKLMFVGGVPEPEDENTGRPYSGTAGELLTRMISAMKFSRASVYVTHAVKCRPPDNHPFSTEHIGACRDFLYREIAVINPVVICTLGDTATSGLLNVSGPLARIRGRFHKYNGIDVMPTYSPEYLLENSSVKRDVWADLQKVMQALKIPER